MGNLMSIFFPKAATPAPGVLDGLVHIRIQQRNEGKTLTTIQGLSVEYDLKKIVRTCKKVCLWPTLSVKYSLFLHKMTVRVKKLILII